MALIPEPIEAPAYVVFMQPLLSDGVYGENVDVSDRVSATGLGAIQRQLDSYSSTIGVFKFANTTVTCINNDGFFNDTGTFFTFKRDLTRVQIFFYDKSGANSLSFFGITNEAGSSAGVNNDTISLLVTAPDSVFKRVQVESGDISNGDTFANAIKSILNKSEITAVMNYDVAKISVSYDGTIDVASALHDKDTKTVLDLLLQVSNSVFYVDKDSDMNVSSRAESATTTTFYGAQDIFGRDNIHQITNYTSGYARLYNQTTVNGSVVTDAASVAAYGLRALEEYTFDFITTPATETAISNSIIAEFKNPKKECVIKVKTEEIGGVNVLEKVVLDLLVTQYNNIDITTSQTWKIIGVAEYPTNFTADIRLREI